MNANKRIAKLNFITRTLCKNTPAATTSQDQLRQGIRQVAENRRKANRFTPDQYQENKITEQLPLVKKTKRK